MQPNGCLPRKRGRPKGSKTATKTAPILPVVHTTSTLEAYRKLAKDLEEAIAAAKKANQTTEVARLSASYGRTLAAIGKLTGEGDITPAMILKSPAFSTIRAKIVGWASRHQEAARELAELLDPHGAQND
jgi:hypothetical protein